MEPEQTIEEYLAGTAQNDRRDRYVYPREAVEDRLKKELEKRTRCKAASLNQFTAELQPREFVSAEPDEFVEQTVQAMDRVAKQLEKVRAKEFDLRFANTGVTETRWGDEVQLRVRVVT